MHTRRVRLLLATALVTIGLMALPLGVASAETIGGTGWLEARGDGIAGLRGNGEVTIGGNGVLIFRDNGGDAEYTITGNGRKFVTHHGWTMWVGFDGEFHVTGSAIVVALSGYNINLYAEGTGTVFLGGEGTYTTGHGTFDWPKEVEAVPLVAPIPTE